MVHAKHPLGWPSTTEVLSPFDLRWLKFFYKKYGLITRQMLDEAGVDGLNGVDLASAASDKAKERGTRYHEGVECLMKGGTLGEALGKVTDNEAPALRNFLIWKINNGLIPLDTEGKIESKDHKYHGSFDGLCKLENTNWITEDFWHNPVPTPWSGTKFVVDHKTIDGRSPNDGEIKKHAMQLASYANGLAEKTGLEFFWGLLLYADMETGLIKPVVIYPLSLFFKPFLSMRELTDLIDAKGDYAHLKRRKTK